jgi:hypothetical protein
MIDFSQGVASIGWAGDKRMLEILIATSEETSSREKRSAYYRTVEGGKEGKDGGRHVAE